MQLRSLCLVLPSDLLDLEPKSPKPRLSPDPVNLVIQPRRRRRHLFSALHRLVPNCRRRRPAKPHSSSCWRYPWSGREDAVHYDSFHDVSGPHARQDVDGGYDGPRTFNYAELYIGSNGFSDGELLGSGGFGRVYRAVLPSDGTTVAVKRLAAPGNRGDREGYQLEKTFAAELAAVAQLRHRNLVPLRGWCVHDAGQLLLVYEYMPNSSLDRLLFARGSWSAARLGWRQRERVVSGLAAALLYLHEQLDTQIVHRDVKASNVMLDSAYNARLGDFGLARWLEHDVAPPALPPESPTPVSSLSTASSSSRSTTNNQLFRLTDTSRIGGTMGYLPPESFQGGKNAKNGGSAVTAKSDVFSFGVVVLEVLTGRRAVDLSCPDDQIVLLDWVRLLADEDTLLSATDRRMPEGSYSVAEMNRLFHLGLLCSLQDPNSRPTMRWVVEILSGNYSGELPALPSFRLHPSYLPTSSSPSPPFSSAKTVTPTDGTTTDTTKDTSSYSIASQTTKFMIADNGVGSGDSSGGRAIVSRWQQTPSPLPLQPPVVVEAPREIPFKEITSITNNFADDQMAVELDFGTAYRGYLRNRNGKGVARVLVKRLGMRTCPALRARFAGELRNLGRLRHRNLVQLRGWCTEQGEMLVVYDHPPSCVPLGLRLFHAAATPLPWRHRYGIVRALASAVLYLHEEWDEQVIHRNITSSAVFLDYDLNPRLGCFALAEFLTRNEGHNGHHVLPTTPSSVRGIFGYMSPEYLESGHATAAADVYSFGVVVLEVVSGRAAVDFRRPEALLLRWVRGQRREPGSWKVEHRLLADPGLDGRYELGEMNRLVGLGLACSQSDPAHRPSMREVVSVLDGNDGLLERIAGGVTEEKDEWDRRNEYALQLVRRIHALGVQ